MKTAFTAALLAAGVSTAACGTTYIDSSATTAPASATTTTLAPVAPDTPIDELLDEIGALMFDLDQRIIDQDGDVEALARIEELWDVADQQIRDDDPDELFNFQQAIDLARSGVERRRPADASKGYKIFDQVAATYLTG